MPSFIIFCSLLFRSRKRKNNYNRQQAELQTAENVPQEPENFQHRGSVPIDIENISVHSPTASGSTAGSAHGSTSSSTGQLLSARF